MIGKYKNNILVAIILTNNRWHSEWEGGFKPPWAGLQ